MKIKSIISGIFLLSVFSYISNAQPPVVPQPPAIPPGFDIVLPKKDVVGEDPKDIPRYKPSVRISYEKNIYNSQENIRVSYYSKDDIDKIRKFYLDSMKTKNWKLVTEKATSGFIYSNIEMKGSRTLEFKKANCRQQYDCIPYVIITLTGYKISNKNYTKIDIDLTKKAD